MRNRFMKYICSGFIWIFFLVSIFLVGEEVRADNGKYTYEISGKTIRQINLANGKIKTTKIKSNKKQSGFSMIESYYSGCSKAVQEKNGYLYYTIDAFDGSAYNWDYICRVKAKNGKGFEVLAKGCNPQIVGNRIYYTKTRFNPNSKKDYSDHTEGVYSMKLNGSGNKKIVSNKELICINREYLYVKDLSGQKIERYNLNGKKDKLITEQSYNSNSSGYYMANGCLIYGVDEFDNESRKWNYYYTSLNLASGEVTTYSTPYAFVGAVDGYLFFKGDYQSGSLYYREMNSSMYKKFGKKIYDPCLCYGSGQKYFMFNVNVKNTESHYNVIINLKKNKLKRVSKYYLS